MNTQRYIKVVGQIVAGLAFAVLAQPASAAIDCAGFPQTGGTGQTFNKSGCNVTSSHRGNASATPNNRNVVVSMNTNTSGGSRRVLTVGLTGGAPIAASCIAQRTSLGSNQTLPGGCSAAVLNGIRMHIQLN
jgi:hypothetical protein